MKNSLMLTVALAAVAMTPGAASAQLYGRGNCETCGPGGSDGYGYSYGDSYKQSYMQNIIWPKQYVHPSRVGIYQAFETQANNGWRRQNMLGKYHFQNETAELTEAGRLKAKWVLTQAPTHRRTVFVQQGLDEAVTTDRIAGVQEFAATLSPNVSPADVQQTHIFEVGRPAGVVDVMFTDFAANQAPPVLPPELGSSSGD